MGQNGLLTMEFALLFKSMRKRPVVRFWISAVIFGIGGYVSTGWVYANGLQKEKERPSITLRFFSTKDPVPLPHGLKIVLTYETKVRPAIKCGFERSPSPIVNPFQLPKCHREAWTHKKTILPHEMKWDGTELQLLVDSTYSKFPTYYLKLIEVESDQFTYYYYFVPSGEGSRRTLSEYVIAPEESLDDDVTAHILMAVSITIDSPAMSLAKAPLPNLAVCSEEKCLFRERAYWVETRFSRQLHFWNFTNVSMNMREAIHANIKNTVLELPLLVKDAPLRFRNCKTTAHQYRGKILAIRSECENRLDHDGYENADVSFHFWDEQLFATRRSFHKDSNVHNNAANYYEILGWKDGELVFLHRSDRGFSKDGEDVTLNWRELDDFPAPERIGFEQVNKEAQQYLKLFKNTDQMP